LRIEPEATVSSKRGGGVGAEVVGVGCGVGNPVGCGVGKPVGCGVGVSVGKAVGAGVGLSWQAERQIHGLTLLQSFVLLALLKKRPPVW
jgi:hypothetical protein